MHEFRYPLFMVFLDIDRLPELMSVSGFTGYNRWNWASFFDRDHFGDPRLPLRARIEADAEAHGIVLPEGRIFLLTHLRYLGYCFNPASFFYCLDAGDRVRAVLAEVNNTFGERQNYWLTGAVKTAGSRRLRYRCPKVMHVSPFMGMNLDYTFLFTTPGRRLAVHMATLEEDQVTFDATLSLRAEPWSAAGLHRALLRHPWMTAKVIAAIHWEALRLYLKKVPVFTHPGRIAGTGGKALAGPVP
jgi:DUF1365 family protein